MNLTFFCACAKSLQLCLTLCYPIGCSPPGSSVHGIIEARRPEWFAVSYSRGSSQSKDQDIRISPALAGEFFTTSAISEALGRCKSLGSLKSFLWPAPHLSGARILCFPILRLLRVPGNRVGSGGLLTAKWQAFFLHPEFPLGLPSGQL